MNSSFDHSNQKKCTIKYFQKYKTDHNYLKMNGPKLNRSNFQMNHTCIFHSYQRKANKISNHQNDLNNQIVNQRYPNYYKSSKCLDKLKRIAFLSSPFEAIVQISRPDKNYESINKYSNKEKFQSNLTCTNEVNLSYQKSSECDHIIRTKIAGNEPFHSATSQSTRFSKVKLMKNVLDQNETVLNNMMKDRYVRSIVKDDMIKNKTHKLKYLSHLNYHRECLGDKEDEIHSMYVKRAEVKHRNNKTKCQIESKDKKKKNLLKIHLFNKTKFDKNRILNQNSLRKEVALKVGKMKANFEQPNKIEEDEKNSKFKRRPKLNSKISSQRLDYFFLANIKKFILIFLSITITTPYVNANRLNSKFENQTRLYSKLNESLINSINSLESLDLKMKLLNSISIFNKPKLNAIDSISAIHLDELTHPLLDDYLNSTSNNLISRTSKNYPNYLNYYQNQISLDGSNLNETNNLTIHQEDKWWLTFFPEKYVDNQMDLSEFLFRIFGVFVCSILICLTLFGNVLTITVVLRFSRMKTVTNILLASLAVADITVALLVMPFLIINDYLRTWPFGIAICHFYISCDVMCCTASIQHLCAVAIDRYWAINKPLHYHRLVNKRRLVFSIILIWLMSVLISFIPVFSGIYHEKNLTASEIFLMNDYPNCYLQVNILYAIFSSTISFYLPLPIMFYVYIRILLIAERQNREIKQLENHLRFNGANYRNSAPAVPNIGSTNLDTRSSTTNITTNSLPIERHIVQHHQQQLHPQLPIQPPVQLPNSSLVQPTLDMFLHGMPSCPYICHCNQMILSQLNDNKKDLKESKDKDLNKELNKELIKGPNKELSRYLSKDLNKDLKSSVSKDANNNTNEQSNNLELNSSKIVEKPDEQDANKKLNEKIKILSNKAESPIQRRSKYLNKQFDVTLLNDFSTDDKESDQKNQLTIDKLSQNSSIKKDTSISLTQSVSSPLVLDSNDDDKPVLTIQQNRTNSNPSLEPSKQTVNNQLAEDNLEQKAEKDQSTKQDLNEQDSNKNDANKQEVNKPELNKPQDQQDPNSRQTNLPHNHCCCFNQHLIFCAYQLHSKIMQQNLSQQQQILQHQPPPQQLPQQPIQQPNLQLQQSSTSVNPLTFAQNLLNILSTHFPPLSEHSNELRDGYSSASTSTLNNLTNHQQLASQTNDNQLLNSQNFSAAIQQLTGINIQFQNPQPSNQFQTPQPSNQFQTPQPSNQKNNQLEALQQFNQFLQQNNLTNLMCDHHHSSANCNHAAQTSSTHQHDCIQHQSCCNWSVRKCSDSSTISGPIQSCSSAASKSMCSSCTTHCHHYPHSLPIYPTNLPAVDANQMAAINSHANVQFDMGSLAGLHQARSNSGSSVAVLDEIKRAERQLRKRSKQILTDTKAIRTLGIVMGVFCVCWLPFFIIYVLLAFWPDLPISYEWKSAVTWLGYLNSSLNPCIYALLNKEFKIAFKRVLHCHPRIMVHNASGNFGNQSSGQRRGRGGLNHSYTQSFSGSMNTNMNNLSTGRSNKRGGGFLSAVGHGCQIVRELSSSGTFNRDLMEYSFGNGNATCLLNLSGDSSNVSQLGQRNQGIRISFDFAAGNLANSPLISNCSTRNPSIASGLEIPIISKISQKIDNNRQLSPQNMPPKINKELLTVQRPGRCILPGSISSEDLIYVNATELHSGGESKESTHSAPEHSRTMNSSSSSRCHSNDQSSFRSKFKLSKYKKKKLKVELQNNMKRTENDENLNENLSTKDKVFLTIDDGSEKSSSYLNLFRRSTRRKKKQKIDRN